MLPHYSGKDRTFFFVGFELTRQASRKHDSVCHCSHGTRACRKLLADFDRGKANHRGTPKHGDSGESDGDPVPRSYYSHARSGGPGIYEDFSPFRTAPEISWTITGLPTRDNQVIARLDESISAADKFNVRYFFDDSFNAQSAGLPAFNSNNDWPTHNGVINESHTFSPRLINLATFLVARNTFIRGPQVTSPANWTGLGCATCQNLAPSDIPTDWAVSAANGFGI